MRVVQGVGDVSDEFRRLAKTKPPAPQPFRQGHAMHQLRNDVQRFPVPPRVVNGNDARVPQLGRGARLTQEALFFRGSRELSAPWQLDRDLSLQFRVLRSPNRSEGARAEQLTQFVATKPMEGGLDGLTRDS